MSARRLPVRPDLDQLRRQAKELLRDIHAGSDAALAALREFHPSPPASGGARLADAQVTLARAYSASSWTRLTQGVRLADAIWRDDITAVRAMLTANPTLIHEPVLIRSDSNWGAPMAYAANLGRDELIRMLHALGARDHEHAAGRAALQGRVETLHLLHDLAGRPPIDELALGGPAYTLSVEGTAAVIALGARVVNDAGDRLAPVDVVLMTDSRSPERKRAILAHYERAGLNYPDTPPMALHRGRIDLLEEHLARDPAMLDRTYSYREIYPAELGCGEPIDATVGTPLDGVTLLQMCIDYDELEIARWLIARGADVNRRSTIGRSGFGGYTALFNTVVSQPNFWMNYAEGRPQEAPFTEMLLAQGADPNVRASIWKRLHPGHGDPARHDYRDVTALSWGRRFHAPIFVSGPAMRLIAEAGGVE